MTIYNIDDRLRELDERLSEAFDEDTGEILDEELVNAIMDEISALDVAREKKIEGALLMRQEALEEAASIANEIKRLTAAKKQRERRADRLKNYAEMALAGEKFKTDMISVSYRKSEAVEITDETSLPVNFWKVKKEPMKTEIKKAIKRGEDVAGAVLVKKMNMIIK